ncbi:RNA-dependent RNA polymerase, partial [Hemipteran phasma-related virus OKIAV247]
VVNTPIPLYIQNMDYEITEDDLKDASLAVDKSREILQLRSTAAERYVRYYTRQIDPKGGERDIMVNDFLEERGLNKLPAGTPDANKTPDILLYNNNVLIMGDVAVSRSPKDIEVRKRVKYQTLMNSIKMYNGNMSTRFEAFVFSDDGNNIEDVFNKIQDLVATFNPFVNMIYGEREAKIKTEIIGWNNLLSFIARNVRNKVNYIYMYQVALAEEEDEMLLGSMREINEYQPKVSERDIADSLFKAVRSNRVDVIKRTKDIDIEGTFQDIDQTRIIEFEPANPKHCIPYIFSSGDNSENTDLDFLDDIRLDLSLHGSILTNLLPNGQVMDQMKKVKDEVVTMRRSKDNRDSSKFKKMLNEKYGRVSQHHCTIRELNKNVDKESETVGWYIEKMRKVNEPKKPSSILPNDYAQCQDNIGKLIDLLNKDCKSTSTNLEFDKPYRGDRVYRESKLHGKLNPDFDVLNKKLCTNIISCIRKFVDDLAHMPASLKSGIYYSIPIQKNMIILVFTGTNLYRRDPSIYFTTIARFDKRGINDLDDELYDNQIKHARLSETTKDYRYLVDKLHKYELSKLSRLSNVDREFRVHYMSMVTMSDLGQEELDQYLCSYSGLTALALIDLHQKPSEMLDLMKYLVAMPMSTHSSLDLLLKDKLTIMLKTDLDVFLYLRIKDFLVKNIKLNDTRKPNQLIVQKDSYILPDSYNITGQYAMFSDPSIITSNLLFYISESQLIFHCRPKKLYNSQFIDKCAYKVAKYNATMDEEEVRNPGWTTEGFNKFEPGKFDFPYENDFCYSRDSMYYAQLLEDAEMAKVMLSVLRTSNKRVSELFPHNLSMRGSCIIPGSELDNSHDVTKKLKNAEEVENMKKKMNKEKRKKNIEDLVKVKRSTTALLNGLISMRDKIQANDTERSRIGNIMTTHKDDNMFFNMSEKEQRGGGRPIGSPDFFTKIRLYCIEMVYQQIGQKQPENLMAKRINRSAKLSNVSRDMIKESIMKGRVYVSNVVMDQSQFSESDNINKFIANIQDNKCIPGNLKRDLTDSITKMQSRTQFFPKLPAKVKEDYPSMVTETKGILGKAGWVQGMLNISSTHIHIIAVKWLTYLFNKYYKEFNDSSYDMIKVEHLVNSDDSFAIISSKHPHLITDFYEFFLLGKRMFCLKQNKKKSYMSSLIGEVIQKYVANGSTINIWAKDAVSVFSSLRGLDMYKDISTAIGSLQTLSRNGAPEDVCCYIRAELKNKIMQTYNVGLGKINDISSLGIDIGKLPIELLGWPRYLTTYEICVAGSFAQSNFCLNEYNRSAIDDQWTSLESRMVVASMVLNMAKKIYPDEIVVIEGDNASPLERDLMDIKRIRLILEEDEGYEDVDIQNWDADIDNIIERDQIAFKSIGLGSSEGSFTKSLLNPFLFLHPFPRKVTDTVRELNNIDAVPSGLAGLVKIRTSIATAVADIKANSNSLLMELSEGGFNNDFRALASASSLVASARCVILSGSRKRHTIKQCFKILSEIAFKMSNRAVFQRSHDYCKTILKDPTYRSEIADEIITNMQDSGYEISRPNVVTMMPELESDLGIVNPLQLVLAEIVKPGTLAKEDYILSYPDQLSSDIDIVNTKFRDWLVHTRDKLSVAAGIYFHYLNVRRARYVVGPPLDKSSMLAFLISWYKCKYDTKFSIISDFTGTQVIGEVSHASQLSTMVLSVAEMYFKLVIQQREIDSDAFLTNVMVSINNTKMTVQQLFRHEDFSSIMESVPTDSKAMAASFVFCAINDDSWLRRFLKSAKIATDWIKEQEKAYNPTVKRVTWFGDFIVDHGNDNETVRVDGAPGDMKCIYSTTENVRKITDFLLHLRKTNKFDNYPVLRDKRGMFSDKFFSTRNEIVISTVDMVIDPNYKYPIIRKNPIKEGKPTSLFHELGLVPIKIVQQGELSRFGTNQDEYLNYKLDMRRKAVVGVTEDVKYVTDPSTGSVSLKNTMKEDILYKLQNCHYRFNTLGLSSRFLQVSGINLDKLIKDDEIKNVIRQSVNAISARHLKEYAELNMPKGRLTEIMVKMILNKHSDFDYPDDEITDKFKIEDIDITDYQVSFELLEQPEAIEEDVEELEFVSVTEPSGSLGGKILETYSTRQSNHDKAADIVALLNSKQVKKAITDLFNRIGEVSWGDEADLKENMPAILAMMISDELEQCADFVKANSDGGEDFELDDPVLRTEEDNLFVNNKPLTECEKIKMESEDLIDQFLANKMFKKESFFKLCELNKDVELNRRNRYINIAKLIIHNINSLERDNLI